MRKILVCLKQVPHKDARLDLRSDGSWIQDDNIKFEINAYDSYALEEALRLKDKGDAEVVVATIGPDRASQSLRTALGMGADRAIHIWDDALASTDSLGIAKALAAVAKSESFDLILTGLMSDDANYGLTGPMLAELLGIPHITSVVKTDFKNGEIEVERELEGGALEVASIPQPCLLAVQTGINEVRYASLKGIMQAKKKPIDVKTPSDVGIDAGELDRPRLVWEAMELPPERAGAKLIDGEPREAAEELARLLREEAKVI